MSGLKSECRKFSPNVFNKTKCQNCFRTKESHSAEALENNRASRNVSKCGYLFVAPDWDFNVSVNRTKRWQRRWFVLYDDGELTYSLDQFPDTIPQGVIDMNKVLDVSDAEGTTGNDFAISITTPDKVHFVKGTSKEESKWWFDALCRVSPRHLSRVKHKRNATFPCGRATIPTSAVISQEYCSEDDMRLNSFTRPKFLSTSQVAQEWLPTTDMEADEDVFSSKEISPYIIETDANNKLKKAVEIHNALNKLISLPEDCSNEPDKNEDQIERSTKDYLSELEESENRRRNRRYLKRENRMQRNQRSRNDGVSKMIPSKSPCKNSTDSSSPSAQSPNVSAIVAAEKLEYLESIHTKNDKSSPIQNMIAIDKEPSSESSPASNWRLPTAKTNLRKSESLKNIPTDADIRDHVTGLRRYHSFKGSTSSHRKLKPSSNTSSLKRTKSAITGNPKATSTPNSKSSVTMTSPLNSNVIISDPIVISEDNTKEGTFTRTGWLFRQTLTKDWSKHWFVLKDSSLTYYRDPSAEHCGIMDGILDLNQVSTIQEQESDKFYAISLRMWDGKKHVLATETEEFRSMWITALQYASNLWSSASKEDFICTEIILPEHTFHQSDRSDRISSPSSLLSLSFADENPRAVESSSYSSDDQSEYFSLVDDDEISDLSSSPRTLPPSPPINRNVISLVKEKSRTRCNYAQKSNSPLSDYGGNTCNNNCNKNADNQLNEDFCNKFQDFLGTGLPVETDSVFLAEPLIIGGLTTENEIPSSPITPPIEFMNELENKTEHKQVNSQKLKLAATEGCSTCLSIRAKFLTAQEEIRKLERELKEAHANFDNLEMFSYKLTQDIKLKEDSYNSQIALMTAKIDDLTSKFTFAEKNYRQLKQKILKNEGKERRRSSLKNKEGLSLTKEYETKLCELEKKISLMEIMVKRDLPDVEMSENSFSDTSSKHSESRVATPSESSETHTPTESVCSENKGFFSRLQSLISKVETVNSAVSVKDDFDKAGKNPKILLPVKQNEELSSLDESDEWQGHLTNTSSSPIPDKYLFPNYPKNLAECQIMLSQKLNDHFKWLKQSLDYINKQEKDECQIDKMQSILVNNLAQELNDLHEEIEVDSLVKQKILFFFEMEKILDKINNHDSIKSMLKINSVESTYSTIFQTLCITFAEYENSDFNGMLISDLPQFHFFCPPAKKLFSPISNSLSDSSAVSERLMCLESQLGEFLGSLAQAKISRYENLWNILADVPVQDDHINKPLESNSVLNCITFIATDIHRIAELQLSNVPKVTSYISEDEYIGAQQWFNQSNKTLKDSLKDFLTELKDKCPMVSESTVSLYKLNETIRADIIRLVVELSFLNICHILLDFLTKYLTYVNQISEKAEQSNCLLKEKWQSLLKKVTETNIFSANTFQCSQCRLLNNLFSETEGRVDWFDFVQKYNNYNLRKVDKYLNYDSHLLQSSSVSACPNCDDKLQSMNQKDVCNNVTCTQCDSWIQKFCAAEKQHEIEQRTLEVKHNAEVKQLEECIIKSSEIHEQELLQKENELATITSQLHRLKSEYEEQKQMLKNFYEEKLNCECESLNEDNIKDAYRLEIEDLKDMFKKGLAAIESSHNRITSEMERRHSEEMALLETEKRQALEVEAQATFTALEAIKKSHAQQLKEETALIKKDLMNKFQNENDCDNMYNKYGAELGKLKAEIMKITEMYSSKCLENVALEEKVNSLRQQLKEAHNELCNLLSKNEEISTSLCAQ